jgi:hypothetical protein
VRAFEEAALLAVTQEILEGFELGRDGLVCGVDAGPEPLDAHSDGMMVPWGEGCAGGLEHVIEIADVGRQGQQALPQLVECSQLGIHVDETVDVEVEVVVSGVV